MNYLTANNEYTGATSTVCFRCFYCELWVHHSTSLIFNFVLILFVACPCSATSREPSSRRNDCPWCRIREWLPHCMHGLYGKSGYIWVLVCEINLINLKQMLPFYILSKYQENSISLMFWRVIWIKGHKVFKNGPSKIKTTFKKFEVNVTWEKKLYAVQHFFLSHLSLNVFWLNKRLKTVLHHIFIKDSFPYW